MPSFEEWESFYLIVGGAAGTLVGLQFVVLTLIADNPPPRAAEAAPVFVTPTIVHFAIVLLLSALMRMPWHGGEVLAVLCGIIGVGGSVYALATAMRMKKQLAYEADWGDWLTYSIVPLCAYALLAATALIAVAEPEQGQFGYAAAALILLFTGVHNAWDSVAYHVFRNMLANKKE